MPGRIRDEDIEAVRSRADLVQVVGQYLQLRKAGRDSFVGLCPFHQEKTPSFNVSQAKQVYHCHGCDASGNVFRFLQNIEHLSFPEAVERLAKQTGVTLRYEGLTAEDRRAFGRKQSLYRANAEAAELYHRFLFDAKEAEEARRYLGSRGITKETATEFQIGFAPGFGDFLLRRLTGTGGRVSPDLLIEAGLASRGSDGRVFDRFRNRIMFPTHDLTGQAVGFGGRILGDGQPKYLNTAETPVFHKGELLYNLHRAKAAITTAGRAVVVEGYTDVILLEQSGVHGVVATNGTAVGEGHFRFLSRFADRAVLAFDSDAAGARAAEKAYAFHENHSVEPVVLVLPEGLDPADFVTKHGAEAFEALIDRAVPLVEYMLVRTLSARPLETIEDRVRAVQAALPIVTGLTDPVRRDQYAGLLADRAGVKVETVLQELERADRQPRQAAPGMARGGEPPAVPPSRATGARISPQHRVEREAVKLLLQAEPGSRTAEAVAKLTPEHFQTALHRRAFETVLERGAEVAGYVGEIEDERLRRLLTELSVEPLEGEDAAEYADGVRLRLEEFVLNRRILELRRQLEPLNPTVDPASYDALFQQLIELEGARRRVRIAAAEEPAGTS